MTTNENSQDGGASANDAGEGAEEDKVSLARAEYDELVSLKATVGSMKRDLKDTQKALEEAKKPKETPSNETKQDSSLLQKSFLRAAGIADAEEVDLALSTAKKWGVEVDSLVDDEDFQSKLKKHRDTKANATATSNIKGGGGTTLQAKNSSEYWLAKGEPPMPEDVPDNKLRRKIIRDMMSKSGSKGLRFYNE